MEYKLIRPEIKILDLLVFGGPDPLPYLSGEVSSYYTQRDWYSLGIVIDPSLIRITSNDIYVLDFLNDKGCIIARARRLEDVNTLYTTASACINWINVKNNPYDDVSRRKISKILMRIVDSFTFNEECLITKHRKFRLRTTNVPSIGKINYYSTSVIGPDVSNIETPLYEFLYIIGIANEKLSNLKDLTKDPNLDIPIPF